MQSSAWLDVMNMLTHVAMVVRKVRGKTTPDSDSESPDYYTTEGQELMDAVPNFNGNVCRITLRYVAASKEA